MMRNTTNPEEWMTRRNGFFDEVMGAENEKHRETSVRRARHEERVWQIVEKFRKELREEVDKKLIADGITSEVKRKAILDSWELNPSKIDLVIAGMKELIDLETASSMSPKSQRLSKNFAGAREEIKEMERNGATTKQMVDRFVKLINS
ncbi:MAG: hypothetical protein ABID38_01955 [Candidatus Diapherotrites archaeon]